MELLSVVLKIDVKGKYAEWIEGCVMFVHVVDDYYT